MLLAWVSQRIGVSSKYSEQWEASLPVSVEMWVNYRFKAQRRAASTCTYSSTLRVPRYNPKILHARVHRLRIRNKTAQIVVNRRHRRSSVRVNCKHYEMHAAPRIIQQERHAGNSLQFRPFHSLRRINYFDAHNPWNCRRSTFKVLRL